MTDAAQPRGADFSFGTLRGFVMRGEIGLAVGVLGILAIMLVPLPAVLLDFLLAISIILSILVLMTALMIKKPLEFTAFPSVLLLATLFRLALNIASTRLILSNGQSGEHAAGEVIAAFAQFVMGGEFVIGVIVFAILVIVNFVVITRGSTRIAEVAARFTLDAMPGKQMAVDADLSSGLINEQQARERRKALEDESSFFGAMDGASKFVRGDAIAGLLITIINILGGLVIGVGQEGMGFLDAFQTYTLLTVGDGLVTQIPALIVSTAAVPKPKCCRRPGSGRRPAAGIGSARSSAANRAGRRRPKHSRLPSLSRIASAGSSYSGETTISGTAIRRSNAAPRRHCDSLSTTNPASSRPVPAPSTNISWRPRARNRRMEAARRSPWSPFSGRGTIATCSR
jgi:hypothetical protein